MDLGHAPAVWLEGSPTWNGAIRRVINSTRKQIYKGRSCFTSNGVKLVVGMACGEENIVWTVPIQL